MSSTAVRRGAAVSGLLLVLFLVAHLGGLIPSLVAPAQFEAYASALHRSAWLPVLEIGLLATALVHLSLTALKLMANRRAGNSAELRSRRTDGIGAMAARSKALAGLVSLGFLLLHLQQLRWPRPANGHEKAQLLAVLQDPLMLSLYLAGALSIGVHLLHGHESAHRSIGALTPGNSLWLRRMGRLLAVLLSGGFVVISLGLALEGHP